MCILSRKLTVYANDSCISWSLYAVCHTYAWLAQFQWWVLHWHDSRYTNVAVIRPSVQPFKWKEKNFKIQQQLHSSREEQKPDTLLCSGRSRFVLRYVCPWLSRNHAYNHVKQLTRRKWCYSKYLILENWFLRSSSSACWVKSPSSAAP